MEQGWPAQWLKGILELCVLAVVAQEDTYGYAIAQRLEQGGLGPVRGGTLYPVLLRLETDGLVASWWVEGEGGPRRKFFRATEKGRRNLAQRTADWQAFTATTLHLLPVHVSPDTQRDPRPS